MQSSLKGMLRTIRSALWFRPSLFCAVAALAAVAACLLNSLLPDPFLSWLPGTDRDGLISFLELLAGSMLTAATVVLSALMLVLNLVAGQASPRAVPELMADTVTQNALGVFLATFVYAVICLLLFGLDIPDETDVTLIFAGAILLVGLSITFLLQWIHHVADALKLNRVIERLSRQADRVLENFLADERDGEEDLSDFEGIREHGIPVYCKGSGYIQLIDMARVCSLANEQDLRVQFVSCEGYYLHPARPVAYVGGDNAGEDCAATIAASVVLGAERSSQDDPQLGIELLAEVASRSLSPGINDPKSAVTCIDYMSTLLMRAARQPAGKYPPELIGEGKVMIPRPHFGDLVERAFHPVIRDGGRHAEVICAILRSLDELAAMADVSHLDTLANEAGRAEAFGKELLQLEADRSEMKELARAVRRAVDRRSDG